MLSRRRFPPPGRVHLLSTAGAGPLLAAVNPTGSLYPDHLARSAPSGRKCLPRDKGHSPRIVADIDGDARGGKSGCGEFGAHIGLAVALQADTAAQLPVVR